ncbi:MAG: translation initiation factor IF-2 N-terminal domain-containing protein, partial [Candidatus Dormibacteria bacterium]
MELPENLTVKSFADALGVSPAEVSKILLQHRILATINQSLDLGTARLVAEQLEVEVSAPGEAVSEVVERFSDRAQFKADSASGQLRPRPPV